MSRISGLPQADSTAVHCPRGIFSSLQPFRGATSLRVPLSHGLASSPLATDSVIYYRAGMGRLDGGPGRAHVRPPSPYHGTTSRPQLGPPVVFLTTHYVTRFLLSPALLLRYLLSSTKQSMNNFYVKGKVKIISVNFMAIFVIAVWKLGVGIQQYC